jgi:hypothetical protein
MYGIEWNENGCYLKKKNESEVEEHLIGEQRRNSKGR